MKICIVGGCGHADSACKAAEQGVNFEVGGICPSYPNDLYMEYIVKRFKESGKVLRIYPDMDTMTEKEHPDILIVDGMYGQHGPMSCNALRKGMHVLCDKPAAVTREQYDTLCQTVKESKNRYWSILTSRYDPWFSTAKRLVDEGRIGEIRLINGQKSYKLGKRPDFYSDAFLYGGTISWVAVHMVDLILWMTGKECVRVSAFGSSKANGGNGSLEASVICAMELVDGVTASIQADYLRPEYAATHGDDRIRIVGTKGSIEVFEEKVYLMNETSPMPVSIPVDETPLLVEEFLDAVSGKGNTRIDEKQSLYTSYVALELTRAMREKRVIILKERGYVI